MKNVCEYCDREFSSRSNLVYHQKHAKYCVNKRSENIPEYPCEYCEKKLGSKYILNNHLGICPIKKKQDDKNRIKTLEKKYKSKLHESRRENKLLERKIEQQAKKIIELEGKLQERDGYINGLKTAPEKKTIYNTAIHPKLVNLPTNNVPALTQEYIIEKVNDGILTYEKASRGYPGILDVISEMITHENDEGEIERNYVCTDVSRNSFHRLLESKKWKSDKGGKYLNNILDTFKSVMEEYKDRVYNMYNNISHDSIEWVQIDWERKNIGLLYSGIMSKDGSKTREELVNILRKEISKRASV